MATRTTRSSVQPPDDVASTSTNQPTTKQSEVFEQSTVHTTCSNCKSDVLTDIQYDSGNLTWSLCFIVALSGLFVGCCLLPFCLDTTKDVLHICPDCGYTIARFNKM